MRFRSRSDGNITLPFYLGTPYTDLVYPYGDGPWTPGTDFSSGGSGVKSLGYEWCWDELHPGPPYRTGGPFLHMKETTDQYTPKQNVTVQYWKYMYSGSFLAAQLPSTFHTYASLQAMLDEAFQDAETLGPTGWNKARPTNSGADLGVFLGEIREVPKMLMKSARTFRDLWLDSGGHRTVFEPRRLADNWLNHQFGWVPFISDLRNFYKTASNLNERLAQLRRDNGKWIRRRRTLSRETDRTIVASSTVSGLNPAINTYLYTGTPTTRQAYIVSRTNEEHAWFSGAFRYYIPGKPGSWEWNARAVAMLFGAYPSPALLWELTPWSWLIDWCSNAGDVIANMSSIHLDRLAAKYAYIMLHRSEEIRFNGRASLVGAGNITGEWFHKWETKVRVPASPFGFGLTGADFSDRQWSILAALGLTRFGR